MTTTDQTVDHRAQFEKDVEFQNLPLMIINSSELRNTGFKLKVVLPPAREVATGGDFRTRGVGLRSLEGMDPKGMLCQWTMTLNSGHDVSK